MPIYALHVYSRLPPGSYDYVPYTCYLGSNSFLPSQEAGTSKKDQTGTAGQRQEADGGRGPTIIDVGDEGEED